MSYRRQVQAHYHNLINSLRTISVPEWISGKAMRASLLGLVIFLSVAYMVRINSASSSGYEMHAMEKQISELTTDVQGIQIKIADAGSMVNIEKRLPNLNYVAVDNIVRYNAGAVVAMAK